LVGNEVKAGKRSIALNSRDHHPHPQENHHQHHHHHPVAAMISNLDLRIASVFITLFASALGSVGCLLSLYRRPHLLEGSSFMVIKSIAAGIIAGSNSLVRSAFACLHSLPCLKT